MYNVAKIAENKAHILHNYFYNLGLDPQIHILNNKK